MKYLEILIVFVSVGVPVWAGFRWVSTILLKIRE